MISSLSYIATTFGYGFFCYTLWLRFRCQHQALVSLKKKTRRMKHGYDRFNVFEQDWDFHYGLLKHICLTVMKSTKRPSLLSIKLDYAEEE